MQLELDLLDFSSVSGYQILLVEDDSHRSNKRIKPGIKSYRQHSVRLRIHRIREQSSEIAACRDISMRDVKLGEKRKRKIQLALDLIDEAHIPSSGKVVVVSNADYGCDSRFTTQLHKRGIDFAVEVRPSLKLGIRNLTDTEDLNTDKKNISTLFQEKANFLSWEKAMISEPTSSTDIKYLMSDLCTSQLTEELDVRLFTIQRGAISGVTRSTIFAMSSLLEEELLSLSIAVSWSRWIRPVVRYQERQQHQQSDSKLKRTSSVARRGLETRPNLMSLKIPDSERELSGYSVASLKGKLVKDRKVLNVVELFAGAGGMGIGFLMAHNGNNPYKLVFSGEVNPIYVQTLRKNHEVASSIYSKSIDVVPDNSHAIDLRKTSSFSKIDHELNGRSVDVLIGGPPCQGFSSANRNSGGQDNPNNNLFSKYIDYVEYLKPSVFVLENVQGVAWAKKYGTKKTGLLDYLQKRMERSGYLLSQKLLDAAWYGVPQYRYRFFAIGIRSDLGYSAKDFGDWGPFPRPTYGPGTNQKYTSVREAIGDLPQIGNGFSDEKISYKDIARKTRSRSKYLSYVRRGAEVNYISDHVTSRHADYVIERYKSIPEGENWESIRDKMTNYANVSKTHSNIYRRLKWDEPSITIGHYRKSMLIHPSQDRGLSWREAARLQSFPDWVRFAGSADENNWTEGLTHKQQQLANAVCPLLTNAVAEFILKL